MTEESNLLDVDGALGRGEESGECHHAARPGAVRDNLPGCLCLEGSVAQRGGVCPRAEGAVCDASVISRGINQHVANKPLPDCHDKVPRLHNSDNLPRLGVGHSEPEPAGQF